MFRKKTNDLKHEAMDRSHVFACMVNDHLSRHPALTKKESDMVRKAVDNLYEVYQLLGNRV